VDYDTGYIGELFLDLIFDLVGDDMSLADGLFSIDEEMEFHDPIESALAYDTGIDIFDGCIASYDDSD
jgi:hypothetical protein